MSAFALHHDGPYCCLSKFDTEKERNESLAALAGMAVTKEEAAKLMYLIFCSSARITISGDMVGIDETPNEAFYDWAYGVMRKENAIRKGKQCT